MDIKELIEEFLEDKEIMKNERIYNEFSLQFELGFYLRNQGYEVYFEKNITEQIVSGDKLDKRNKKSYNWRTS